MEETKKQMRQKYINKAIATDDVTMMDDDQWRSESDECCVGRLLSRYQTDVMKEEVPKARRSGGSLPRIPSTFQASATSNEMFSRKQSSPQS